MWDETLGYQPPDYLDCYDAPFHRAEILALREERQASLLSARSRPYREATQSVRHFQPSTIDLASDTVTIGQSSDLSAEQRQQLQQALQTFCPWKKGPFNFFGIDIDAEWRSDWKWQRVLPHIQPLKQRRVADIGCHNGYFMFRMAEQQPACVVGFEPVAKHFWAFQMVQNWLQNAALHFELLGVEHVHHYPDFFDTIFCLGILYHHTDPVGLLRKLRQALAPGGELVVDCQGIPNDLPIALTPRKRYARSRGIWFLPSQSCLENWLARAGFQTVRCIFAAPLSTDEQRRTVWANIDSLQEFLDPEDPSLTVEGYPAPWRYYLIANKN